MKVGISLFTTDRTPPLAPLAARIEELGFESVFVPEHTHIPVAQHHPYPLGGEIPDRYSRILDPFVALAVMAAATSTLRLGAGVCVVPDHDPIVLAKTIATLDYVSGGRVVLGCGVGWNGDEIANHGVAFADRWQVTRERIAAMRAVWTHDDASFDGEFVRFDPIRSWPKPVQAGGPPVLMGVNGPRNVARVADVADGWILVPGPVDRLRGLLDTRAAGAPGLERATVYLDDADERSLSELSEAGVERCLLPVPPDAGAATADAIEALAARLRNWAITN